MTREMRAIGNPAVRESDSQSSRGNAATRIGWLSLSLVMASVSGFTCDPITLEPEDECETVDEKWCDDDRIMLCEFEWAGHWGKNEITLLRDCVDYAAHCAEQGDTVGCVMSDTPCPEGAVEICVEDYLCDCSPGLLPILSDSTCGTNPICVELEDPPGTAECAALPEPCDEEGAQECFEIDGEEVVLKCGASGVWKYVEVCEDGESCVEQGAEGAVCQ